MGLILSPRALSGSFAIWSGEYMPSSTTASVNVELDTTIAVVIIAARKRLFLSFI